MLNDGLESPGFCGAYGVDDSEGAVTQEMTPVRQTVAEVVADLRAARRAKRKLQLAQIIDLKRLEPIEPAPATMARLDESGTRSA
jgi:hypothetical protein